MFDYLVLHVFIHVIIYYALSRTNNYATSLIEIKMRKKKDYLCSHPILQVIFLALIF